jgi:L-lactate dehydrogenase complex protein LldG
VAIVRRADIHRSLCAEISALGGDPYVVRCTGPSKTADVEGILIQGVHGPGEPIAQIVDAW